jgi:hypothetical protein
MQEVAQDATLNDSNVLLLFSYWFRETLAFIANFRNAHSQKFYLFDV